MVRSERLTHIKEVFDPIDRFGHWNVDGEGVNKITHKVTVIEQPKIRRKGRVGKSIGIGAGAGLVLGAIGGYSFGDDVPGILSFSAEDKAIFLGQGPRL